MLSSSAALAETGLAGAALKPAECDVARGVDLPVARVVVDYEGREHLPDADALAALAEAKDLLVTTPVRADGFDPLGDDGRYDDLPETATPVLVAGHPAFLGDDERGRAIAPRLAAARERTPDAWVGTESIERLALAVGGTQFELLSATTDRAVRSLRTAGFEGTVAVYAPTVLTDDEDAILDAVGGYAARRRPVAEALPDGAATDATATGRAREVLLAACEDYALVGGVGAVADRVAALEAAGVDSVVGYPARGVDAVL